MADFLGNDDGVHLGAILHSVSLRVDRSMHLAFETNEVPDDQKLRLFRMHLQFGTLLFYPEGETPAQFKPAQRQNVRSLSQRLRDVLYRLWEQEGQVVPFEQYYAAEMEKLITHYKGRLV